MRPTIDEVHCNADFFIGLLKEAGMVDAEAKVRALSYKLINYYQMAKVYKTSQKILTNSEQYLHRFPPNTRYNHRLPKEESIRVKKAAGPQRQILIRHRQYVEKHTEYFERKIAEWPDLEYDPTTLAKHQDPVYRKKMLKKRGNRPRRTTRLD